MQGMKVCKINDFISLRFENDETFIYVNGRKFIQCIRLVLQIHNANNRLFKQIDSIDEAVDVYNKYLYLNEIIEGPMAHPVEDITHDISPETEFWGHCSNLQAWAENNYNTRILHRNLAFPL